MDIVEQYVKLNTTISELEHRASVLRQDILSPGARLNSSLYEVVVRRQMERVFKTELLPPEILNDPKFWHVAERAELDVQPTPQGPVFVRPDASEPIDLLRYRC